MFDFKRTLTLIRGAIFEPEPTWARYLPEAGDWKKTAALLSIPLVVGALLLSYLLSLILPATMPFGTGPTFRGLLAGIVWALAGLAITAFIVSSLAGMFKGQQNFGHGLAAVSLSAVPAYVGQILGQIPWVGWLFSLALAIYSLVLLWRIIPSFLNVPESSRVGHYILSVVGSFVAMLILGTILGLGRMGAGGGMGGMMSDRGSDPAPTGLFGGMGRQGEILESASQDTYDPPADGELTERQVREYIDTMRKTKSLRTEQSQRLKEISERAEGQETEDFGELFSGVSQMMEMSTAEMEVVKTAGGNWAEHQWIKEQLRIARIQQDLNPAVAHNYDLYLKYEDEINAAER